MCTKGLETVVAGYFFNRREVVNEESSEQSPV